jgi:hypothetical protein
MAYKVEGTASDDCKIYVINTATDIVDRVESVSAGAYEIGLLTADNIHVLAEPDDVAKSPITYTNIDTVYYAYIQPTFGLNLKEVKRHGSYSAGVVFSSESGPTLRGYNGGSSLGWANSFCVFDKDVIVGNKVQVDWSGTAGAGDNGMFKVIVADGTFDRTNDADFPQSTTSPWLDKGGGDLEILYEATSAGFSRNTITTGVLSLSGSTQSQVTVFVTVGTSSGNWAYYDLYTMNILSSSDAIITEATIDGSLVWVEGGVSDWEYGKLGTPVTVSAQ